MIEDLRNKRIGVLMGGPSAEREISLKSGRAISTALQKLDLKVVEIGEQGEIKAGVIARHINVAFIALHGRFGEDGQVQALLEDQNIPYTGSAVEASRRALNKITSRRIFQQVGLHSPPYRVSTSEDEISSPPFPFPVVVKPSREGSSIGLTIARSQDEYTAACQLARQYDRHIIIERYIQGSEMTVGILGDRALPIINIVPKNPYFDFEAKYTKGMSEFILPAPLPAQLYQEVEEAGLRAHRSLGCYAYSRIDIIVGEYGIPYILEVNTIPGFTENSLFPLAAREAGIEFPDLCLKLLDLALKRFQNETAD